jgi:hypothetical protein
LTDKKPLANTNPHLRDASAYRKPVTKPATKTALPLEDRFALEKKRSEHSS